MASDVGMRPTKTMSEQTNHGIDLWDSWKRLWKDPAQECPRRSPVGLDECLIMRSPHDMPNA